MRGCNTYTFAALLADGLIFISLPYMVLEVKEKTTKYSYGILLIIEVAYRALILFHFLGENQNSQKIMIYLIYQILRLLWFYLFVEDYLRQYFRFYLCTWIGALIMSTVCGGILAVNGNEMALRAITVGVFDMSSFIINILFCVLTISVSFAFFKVKYLSELDVRVLETGFYFLLFGEVFTAVAVQTNTYPRLLAAMLLQAVITVGGSFGMTAYYKKIQVQDENIYLQKRLKRSYQYYEQLCQNQKKIAELRHDLSNHLQVLSRLDVQDKEQERINYQKTIDSYYNRYLEASRLRYAQEPLTDDVKAETENANIWRTVGIILGSEGVLYLMNKSPMGSWEMLMFAFLLGLLILSVYVSFLIFAVNKERKRRSNLIKNLDEEALAKKKWEEINAEIKRQKQQIESVTGEQVLQLCDDILKEELTGNAVLDIMLHSKMQECKENDIEIDIHMSGVKNQKMKHMDLVGLIGNMLDNAIEACMKCEGNRYIKVESGKRANFWRIQVENTKLPEEMPKKNNFLTSKPDKKEHGQGMGIIRTIAEEYDGAVYTEDRGTTFVVQAMVNMNSEGDWEKEK